MTVMVEGQYSFLRNQVIIQQNPTSNLVTHIKICVIIKQDVSYQMMYMCIRSTGVITVNKGDTKTFTYILETIYSLNKYDSRTGFKTHE